MKRSMLSLVLILSFLGTPTGFSYELGKDLPKWIGLLEKGNERERKLALHSLWFLKYPEFRKDAGVFNPVLSSLKDRNPSIREAAAACLKHIGELSNGCCKETGIVPSLIAALEDSNPRVRAEAAKALGYYKDERAADPLIARLRDKDPWARLEAIFALGEIGTRKALDPLLALLEDNADWKNKFVQQECITAAGKIGAAKAIGMGGGTVEIKPGQMLDGKIVARPGVRVIPGTDTKLGGLDGPATSKLISVLIKKSDDPYLRTAVIKALIQFKAVEARDILLKATEDPDEKIRKLALSAIPWLSPPPLRDEKVGGQGETRRDQEQRLEIFKKSLKDPSAMVRATAIRELSKSGNKGVIDPLLEALGDTDDTVRRNAMEGLAQFKDDRILDSMLSLLEKKNLNLGDQAKATFRSVAKNGTRGWVYVYRVDSIRRVSRSRVDIPEGIKISERRLNPTAVGRVLEFLGHSDQEGKMAALDLLWELEDERIEGVLLKLFDDPSPRLRERAISLAPLFCQNTIVPKLIVAAADQDVGVRGKAVGALGEFKDKRALETLLGRARDQAPSVREAAVKALGQFKDKTVLEALLERASDEAPGVRGASLNALKDFDDPRVRDLTIKSLSDDSISIRRAAVSNLQAKPDRKAVEPLIRLLKDPDFLVASKAAEVLGATGDKRAIDALARALKGESEGNRSFKGSHLRRSAANALGQIGGKEAILALEAALDDKDSRIAAISALRSAKDARAVPALIKCLSDKDPNVRGHAASALKEIGDPAGLEAIKDFPKDMLIPDSRIAPTPLPFRPLRAVPSAPVDPKTEQSGRSRSLRLPQ